jgi:hypothetical protein
MDFEFDGPVWWWRGPSPWHFVSIPEELSALIKERAGEYTFGWGMIPGTVTIGGTTWYTAFFEKDGVYVIPVKSAIRKREGVELDDVVHVRVVLGGDPGRDPSLRL